jgi:hypothetical protein
MSNVGLGNLTSLKAVLLPEAMRSRTEWDDAITALGKGVAIAFEAFTARKFEREAGATFIASADRSYLILPRFPIETITALAQRDDYATGFVSLALNTILNVNESTGWVDFGSPLGSHNSTIRVTYTGGYHWEELEPTDGSYPTTVPTGATVLPADLLHAWHLQCEAQAIKMDLLNGGAARRAQDKSPELNDLKLIPAVVEILNAYRRFA